MVEIKVINKDGKESGAIDGSDRLFTAKYKEALVHQALRAFRGGLRAGTHSTKTRGEVRGGGKKPWKQKGTGRARAGSIRSPLWNGGGVTFGPKPRDYSFALPKKMKKAALRTVVSDRLENGMLKIIDEIKLASAKTKGMVAFLTNLGLSEKKVLMVLSSENKNVELAGRNIQGLIIVSPATLNIFDLLNCECLVMEKDAVPELEKNLS